jgi:hypothetical protein
MKRRVTLPLETLEGRILPGASSGGTYLGDLGNPVLTYRPDRAGDGIQVLSSKSATCPGSNMIGRMKRFGSKPAPSGGSN